jgi:hypothetical protein
MHDYEYFNAIRSGPVIDQVVARHMPARRTETIAFYPLPILGWLASQSHVARIASSHEIAAVGLSGPIYCVICPRSSLASDVSIAFGIKR